MSYPSQDQQWDVIQRRRAADKLAADLGVADDATSIGWAVALVFIIGGILLTLSVIGAVQIGMWAKTW